MQIFVTCPFCSKVFDTMEEPFVSVSIDQRERKAHFKCVPIRLDQPILEQRKEAAE